MSKLTLTMDTKNNQFVKVRLEAGTHYVCACERTSNQPFCDGSHVNTGTQPLVLELEQPKMLEVSDLHQT